MDAKEQAKQDYLSGMKYKDLAEKYQVTINTIKSWKQRYGWKRKGVHTKSEKGCAQKHGADAGCKPEQNKDDNNQKGPELTEKQVLFVAEYLIDFNATRAAMAVGYSKKTAHSIGWENLRKPAIQEEIKRQTELVTYNLGITSQRVLLEYLKIAFTDISEYVTFGQREVQAMGAFGPLYEGKGKNKKPIMKTVNFVDLKESGCIDTSLISEIKQSRDGVSIKFHDKMKALEKLERYLDLLPDQHKRMVEEEKIKLAREQLELNKAKVTGGPGDEVEDDGFLEALNAEAADVWGEDYET